MSNEAPDPLQTQLRHTKLIFAAIASAVLIFMFVSLVVNQVSGPFDPEVAVYSQWLMAGLGVLSLVCMTIAKMGYTKEVRYAKENLNSDLEKLIKHRAALIRYLAICEMPAIGGVLLFLFSGNFAFLAFTAVLLGFMLSRAPSAKKLSEELLLDWK